MSQYNDTIRKTVLNATETIQHLGPGPLAELRRMKEERIAAPAFWKLAVAHPYTIGREENGQTWVAIVRIIAILMPKGDPGRRPPLHDSKRPLGEVLCDGGNPDWRPDSAENPKPVFSERRLMQLLSARGRQREVLLTRAARAIAHSRRPDSGVNTVDVAYTLLMPKSERQLAEPYYRRLDGGKRSANEPKGETA